MSLTSWSSRALVAGLVAILAPATLSLRGSASRAYTSGQRYEDVYYLPPTGWLNTVTLGFREAAADLLWMRSLLYFGKEISARGQSKYIFNYIEAMVTLDPDFKAAYKWAAMAGLYHSGTITPEDGKQVVSYLERAIDRWPDDGELYWELGSALRFEMAPLVNDAQEKQRLYEAAMEPLATAARLGAGPAWLAGLNAQLFRKLGKTEQAIRHIEEMYDTVEDPRERQEMQWELARLRSERYATAFQSATDDLRRNRDANYPYLSANLFVLLGPRVNAERNKTLAQGFIPATDLTFLESDGEEGAQEATATP